MKPLEVLAVLVLVAAMSLAANLVGAKIPVQDALPGMAVLIAICIAGVLCAKYIPVRIPSVAYIVTIACIMTYPGFPGSAVVSAWMKKVNFLALTTPILAYAGVALGKDLDMLKKTGWRIVVVSFVVFIGTYIGSAVIAQVVLKMIGEI